MAFSTFLAELSRVPNPPCERCALKRKCAEDRLACRAFLLYAGLARKGDDRRAKRFEPTRWIYQRIFPGEFAHQPTAQIP